ncbi:MAG: hypothetical protein ACXQS8_04140 [Candidatus Helarchaeales archaeon]
MSRERKRFSDDRNRRRPGTRDGNPRDGNYQRKNKHSRRGYKERGTHRQRNGKYSSSQASRRREDSKSQLPRMTLEEYLKGRNGMCGPACPDGFFRCQKRALGRKMQDNDGNLVVECNFIEGEYCEGPNCKFSFCARRKMRPDGKCAAYRKSQDTFKSDWDDDNEEHDIDEIESYKSFRVQGRLKKKIKYLDDFDDF